MQHRTVPPRTISDPPAPSLEAAVRPRALEELTVTTQRTFLLTSSSEIFLPWGAGGLARGQGVSVAVSRAQIGLPSA